jgi:hypothetical protein
LAEVVLHPRTVALKRDWQSLRGFFGRCLFFDCKETEGLEFIHLSETDLRGMGRGYKNKVGDIRTHPYAYSRACREHHRAFDKGEYSPYRPPTLLQVANDAKVRLFPRFQPP